MSAFYHCPYWRAWLWLHRQWVASGKCRAGKWYVHTFLCQSTGRMQRWVQETQQEIGDPLKRWSQRYRHKIRQIQMSRLEDRMKGHANQRDECRRTISPFRCIALCSWVSDSTFQWGTHSLRGLPFIKMTTYVVQDVLPWNTGISKWRHFRGCIGQYESVQNLKPTMRLIFPSESVENEEGREGYSQYLRGWETGL